jgi:signal transduction histidine kinase
MTHDIKNLLQSLNVLCSVAAEERNRDSRELQALVRRQLPAIAQRLAATLEKLQRPQEEGESYFSAQAWWEGLVRQYRSEGVEFQLERGRAGARVPRSLFDSVADNLVRNALAKREADPSVRIVVSLLLDAEVTLQVKDSGGAVPEDVAKRLLRGPVASNGGLGIGLYQAARQAEAAGYALTLESNRDGEVCFALKGPLR